MRWNDGMERLFGVPLASLPPDGSSWTLRLHPTTRHRCSKVCGKS